MIPTSRPSRNAVGVGVDRVTVLALLVLAIAQAADLLTFFVMIEVHGLAAEVNPLVAALAGHDSRLLSFAKVALVVYVSSAFLIARLRCPRAARAMLTVGIVVGLIGAATNIGSI